MPNARRGCDQFEIMFNRPGGQLAADFVPTYIFGSYGGEAMVTEDQWDAMRAVWDDCGYNGWTLDDHNDDTGGVRRAWFYTGGGLPLNDDGTLRTDGGLGRRSIAPATPGIYLTNILEEWTTKDDRFRCLFADAASPFFGKFVELVQDSTINEEYTLVGEAIPTDEAARHGAPWMSLVRFARAPWWKLTLAGVPDRELGYNWSWATDPATMPVYFAVLNGAYSYLAADVVLDQDPGDGSNLTIGQIYTWVRKGGTPIAWNAHFAKVGAAWDYATNRVRRSRVVRNPRSMRGVRA